MEIKRVTEIKLKPCPFCGGEVKVKSRNCGTPTVTCEKCGLEFGIDIHYTSPYQLAKAWNRRATGMLDNHDNMIYDGDICYDMMEEEYGVVKYSKEDGMFYLDVKQTADNFGIINSQTLEIVGNIYDDYDLLKDIEKDGENK